MEEQIEEFVNYFNSKISSQGIFLNIPFQQFQHFKIHFKKVNSKID